MTTLLGFCLGLTEPTSRRNDGDDCCGEGERKLDLTPVHAAAEEVAAAAAMLDDIKVLYFGQVPVCFSSRFLSRVERIFGVVCAWPFEVGRARLRVS